MTWLRVDPGFVLHPKIVELTDREFRAWVRLLCYCAQAEDPTVDASTIANVPRVFRRDCARFAALGLLDPVGEKHEVHNWIKYLPKDTPAERQAAWRARKALAADVTRASTPTSTSASTNGSTETSTSRARHFGSYSDLDSDVDSKAGLSSSSAREGLPESHSQGDDRKGDPVIALLIELKDADAGTETVLRSFNLPEFAYRNAAEQVREQKGGVKLAVAILKRFKGELEPAVVPTPDADIPF